MARQGVSPPSVPCSVASHGGNDRRPTFRATRCPAAPPGLIEENPNSVIVLDDVSMIFKQPRALHILLAALGTPHDGSRTRTVRYKKGGDDRTVFFDGGIIAISNLALSGHSNEVLEALQDRVHAMSFEPSDGSHCGP